MVDRDLRKVEALGSKSFSLQELSLPQENLGKEICKESLELPAGPSFLEEIEWAQGESNSGVFTNLSRPRDYQYRVLPTNRAL